MTAKTTDPIASPVTTGELAEWLSSDSADPLLPGILLAATDAVIRHLQYDLMPRDWVLTLWDWPSRGARTHPNVSASSHQLRREIQLPYAGIVSVSSVLSYGHAVSDFVEREDSIVIPTGTAIGAHKDNESPAIVVSYTAGMSPVPDSILTAIKMLAAFLYEHRGECDVLDAMSKSGAAVMLQPYKRNAVVF